MFADQFEADGQDYLYRKSMRAAPIRVTASERDEFVSRFARDQRRLTWIFVTLIVLGIAALVALVPSFADEGNEWHIYVVGVVAIAVFTAAWRTLWNAPARALEQRATVGAERTRAEAGRAMLAKMSWSQLIAIMAGSAFAWWSFAPEHEAWIGWRLLWLIGGLALIGALTWRAWQKWRIKSGEM